jgi:hypothetical protein
MWHSRLINSMTLTAGARHVWQQHQDRVIADTALFRPNGSEPDSLFGRFWDHWRRQHARGKRMGELTSRRQIEMLLSNP